MLIPIRRPSTTHLRFASQVAYGFENREDPSSSSSSSSPSSSSSSSSPSPSSRVPLKSWQKGVIAFGSTVGAFMDPSRADLIAALGETTGKMAFQHMLERMKSHPEGKRVLADRPRVKMASVGHVWNLPENTFGAAYAKFMGKRDFSPDDRPPVRFMDTEELTYVATRAREVHDFWHVLFELPTSGLGESVLKIVEFQQTYLPMCFISAIGGTIRLNPSKRDVLLRDYMPWALKAGRASSDLMCIYYEEHFHEDLGEVRNKWGILPAPAIGGGTKFK